MALIAVAIAVAVFILISSYLAWLRLRSILNPNRPKAARDSRNRRTHLLVVLGSGGHSAEMLSMFERAAKHEDEEEQLEWRDFKYRSWVVGTGDSISAIRAKEFEDMARGMLKGRSEGDIEEGWNVGYRVVTVPRAREIHQSLLTAPVSCLRCLIACWTALVPSSGADSPDIIICNGPATATIVIFTSILLRFFDVRGCNSRGKMRTIYIESWARVRRLSLSGKLLLPVVDRFIVQWPQLLERTKRKGEYLGVLVS